MGNKGSIFSPRWNYMEYSDETTGACSYVPKQFRKIDKIKRHVDASPAIYYIQIHPRREAFTSVYLCLGVGGSSFALWKFSISEKAYD